MHIDEQRGSILIFSVLMLGVILTITLTLGNIFLPKLKTSTQAINSTVASYTADGILEWCLYTQRGKLPALERPIMTNGATFRIFYAGTNTDATCAPTETPLGHRAVGTYQRISRSFIVEE